METLDKKEIGRRIKQLRKEKDLKQWQMADLLGATQPAIHKYENGILPEVKRLLELARIGQTTVEWILTGQHWENGSQERARIPVEVYRLAERFYRFTEEERRTLSSALDMLEKATRRIREKSQHEAPEPDVQEISRLLLEFDGVTRRAIVAALGVHEAILESLVDSRVHEFQSLSAPAPQGSDLGEKRITAGSSAIQEESL